MSQQTAKTDSIYTLEGSRAEIDSAIKILDDYPDLLKQKKLLDKVLKDERSLTAIERAQILKVLNLKEWNIEIVTKAIKKLRRKLFWAPLTYAGPGALAGTIAGIIIGLKL